MSVHETLPCAPKTKSHYACFRPKLARAKSKVPAKAIAALRVQLGVLQQGSKLQEPSFSHVSPLRDPEF